MKRKGNITVTLLISLVVVCSGAALLSVASASRYQARTEYERLQNRYIAESGIDMAIGLFLNYLDNQEYVISYTCLPNGECVINGQNAPYIVPELRTCEADADMIRLSLMENEGRDYLSAIGFRDFQGTDSIQFALQIYGSRERFRLPELCTDSGFAFGNINEVRDIASRLLPLRLSVRSSYRGGEVLAGVTIDGLTLSRDPFFKSDKEQGSILARVSTSAAKVSYETYQNYRRSKR